MTLKPPIADTDHTAGAANAHITLVEYGDYQCPHCAAAEPVVRAIQRTFGADLLFAFRNFPLTESHPAAEAAAELAEYAAEHGKFWETHHAIFAWSRQHGPQTFGVDTFVAIAESVGLDPRAALVSIEQHRYLERIRTDFASGVRSGVNGTPTLFVNGQRYDGPVDEDTLARALEAARHHRA